MKNFTKLFFIIILCTFSTNATATETALLNANLEARIMQRVRIDVETPLGYVRPLLLGFTTDNTATDGADYGYDGLNFDNFPDDMNWMIENNRYVIQGVGAFDDTKQYPLGLFLTNSGEISISLKSLENFDTDIEVFVFDSLLNTYTLINDSNFSITMNSGDYIDRFYIAFKNQNEIYNIENTVLSVDDNHLSDTIIQYFGSTNHLFIKLSNQSSTIKTVNLYSINGQLLKSFAYQSPIDTLNIPLKSIKNQQVIVQVNTQNHSQGKLLVLY